jgi:hypothetical protein
MSQALASLSNARADFQNQKIVIMPGKKVTLHIFAEDRTDVEIKVRQTLWESQINFEALNKDLNNEIFIAFLTENDCDAALDSLMNT